LNLNGTFWLSHVIAVIGGVWAWYFIPETAGPLLEQMSLQATVVQNWYLWQKKRQREVAAENDRWK
jgi:hypothetical protein